MVIGDIQICIDGSNIENTKTSKFLGIYIDQSLTWDEHIKYTCNKLAKITGILIRARNKLYTPSLVTLYNTLALPYFSYGITLWGKTYKESY